MTNHHQQRHTILDHGCEFIGFVADPAIMGDGDPAALANIFQPLFIRAIGCKVIGVPFNLETGSREYFWKAFSEITIREENVAHAARS